MKTLKSRIKDLWSIFAGGGTVLGYQAYLDRMNKKKEQVKLNDEISSVRRSLDSMNDKINNCVDLEYKQKLLADQKDLSSIFKDLKEKHDSFVDRYSALGNDAKRKETLFDEYIDHFSKEFEKASKKAERLDDLISNKFNGGWDIWNIVDEFNKFLSNLSIIEICLVINVFGNIFVLGCFSYFYYVTC